MKKENPVFNPLSNLFVTVLGIPFTVLQRTIDIWEEIEQARWAVRLLIKGLMFLVVVAVIIGAMIGPISIGPIIIIASIWFAFCLLLMGITKG